MTNTRLHGSFRDPSGSVHSLDGRIFRCVSEAGKNEFKKVLATGYLQKLVMQGRLMPFELIKEEEILSHLPQSAFVMEHPKLEFVSYPYEWPFGLLKSAALLHLDIAMDALENDIVLSDATAYNVQFIGTRPVMIDHLSFILYREGEYWHGHRQFCEQFLSPLLMQAHLDVAYNSWYRGTLDGISVETLARLLPWYSKVSFRMLSHVVLPAMVPKIRSNVAETAKQWTKKPLPKMGYLGLLKQLRKWISGLKPSRRSSSAWGQYESENTYSDSETKLKSAFVANFCDVVKPGFLFDLGCNAGYFSKVALEAGAGRVVGFDSDHQALHDAVARAKSEQLAFLPLYFDASNPSPSQGWRQRERLGLAERSPADGVLCLALIHHLAIGKNVPLDEILTWLLSLAPEGVIEFVQKSDPTVQTMLTNRPDIFPDYTQENFETLLIRQARIISKQKISSEGRHLYHYRRA